MTMRSDSTLVPPVTAERSPPLSRMTGADSPVMADSSTEATPSITSPSPGISSPASTTTRSPARRAVALHHLLSCRRAVRRAVVWVRIRRSDSACALPRPSATASAKLANRTVNHSHSDTLEREPQRRVSGPPATRSRKNSTVVSTLPTSTTNITGLRATWRGDSLRTLSTAARLRIRTRESKAPPPRSGTVLPRGRRSARGLSRVVMSVRLSCESHEVLGHRAQAQRREESQRPDDEDHRRQQHREQQAVGGEGPRPRRRPCACRPSSRRWRAPGRSSGNGRTASPGRGSCCRTGVFAFRPANAEPLFPVPLVKA